MPVEIGLWRVDDKPVRLVPGGMPTEARLKELIKPTILSEPLLIIGRQVSTGCGKVIDLRAVDGEGVLHVIELKKIRQDRAPEPTGGSKSKAMEPWNGRDWYVSFGEFPDGPCWEDGVKYGFVSAGGGEWYSPSIRKLSAGARIFTFIPKAGYVGVGIVTGDPMPFAEATVDIDGRKGLLAGLQLASNYVYTGGDEWVLPVRWLKHRPRERAFWKSGLFANQNSATKLRNRFTLEQLTAELGLETDESGTVPE